MKKNTYIQPAIEVVAQIATSTICISPRVNNSPLNGGIIPD